MARLVASAALLVLLISSSVSSAQLEDCHVHVSPAGVQSPNISMTGHALTAARDAVRQLLRSNASATSDIIVCLAPGVYDHSSAPLALSHEDDVCGYVLAESATRDLCRRSPPRRVRWRGSAAGASIVSGGVQITGWSPTTLGGGAVYAASVPAGTFSSGLTARAFWVAGNRTTRTIGQAQSLLGPMTAWVSASGDSMGYTVGGSIPAAWAANNTQLIEFTWPIVIANWIAPRCTIASVDVAARNITLTSPCGGFLVDRTSSKGDAVPPPPVTVEAAPTFPLAAGTFYHDAAAGVIFYALQAWQTPAQLESDAWVSPAEVLLQVANVTGHSFEGISYAYSTWNQANTADGFVDDQSCVHACTPGAPLCGGAGRIARARGLEGPPSSTAEPPGAVRVLSSASVSFVNCTFVHMGAPYALQAGAGSQDVAVSASTFTDLSGGFLKLGDVDATHASSPDPSQWDARATIASNTAADMALEYGGAAGLFAGYLFSATIAHNAVADAGYSGMSVGWGWGTVFPAGVGNNSITGNRISNVMRVLRDGGGIYLNGATNASFPSVVSGNWVDYDNAVYAVYYLDNGASHWLVTDNVASHAPPAWAFFMQGCCQLPALDSHVQNFWYAADEMLAPQNNCAAEGCTVNSSTVYAITGGAWPAAALAIMNASGPQ